MKLIKTHLIHDPKHDKHKGGHANRQAQCCDERKNFIAVDVPVGDFEVMLNHN